MSFGTGGGFGGGGFGSSTTNNTGSLFGGGGTTGGGFGSSNNTNTGGFGAQNTNTFGSTANNTTGGGFGMTFLPGSASMEPLPRQQQQITDIRSGGFGSNNNTTSAFGAKPTFGTNTASTGGLFGSTANNNTSTGGFGAGGFGSTATNNNTSGFGSGGSTGGLFGAAKPASTFGNSGSTLFGGGGSTFGNNTNNTSTATSAFGASPATGVLGECPGTASPAYNVTTEKEPNSPTVVNHFQSITHMPNYQKWSFEELRLADYNAGRRFANASGQAGGFGASTGFGGFNNTNQQTTQNSLFGGATNNTTNTSGGGLFGSANNTGTGFGTNNQTNSTAFGGFGAAKPATGGLFGSTPSTTTQNQTGSLFGGSGGFGATNTGTGFGTNNASTGGFGSNNTAAKPSLFGTQSTNTGGGLFGSANTTNNNTGGGLFGSNNQPQSTGFGNTQTNNTSGLFGGASNTGGGLFGNNNNNQAKPSLFSNAPATNTGSLFGGAQPNNQQQGGGGGLFGNTNNATNNNSNPFGMAKQNGTTSLFGNPQPQNQGSGLFGNAQQNQPTQGGLFGNANKPSGGLFGSSTTQNNTGGSLFGASQQQQPQPQNSLFGNSMNTNQATNLQPPQGLTTSIMDPRPYGSVSIFDGLPPPPTQNLGPIATPIVSGQKQKKPAVLPQWKLNPTMSPRFVTPQKQGYGFSYSRYGTPSSISSVASTPGHFGNSLLGSSIGRNLGKSASVSNLRRNYDTDAESILAPGAFTSSSRLSGQHSLKKLNIDRSLRNDLFAPVTQGSTRADRGDSRASSSSSALKKRVSFEASSFDSGANDDIPRITENNNSPTPSAEEQGYLRSSTNRNLFNGQPTKERRSQEVSPVKGNELAIVPEDGSPEASKPSASSRSSSSSRPGDPQPGNYITRPSVEDLKKMTPEQLKKVSGFVVSRENVGSCAFQQAVDLSWVKWDNFFDVIVKFALRSICVYPDQSRKPPLGMGINVPSIITLENCWPKNRGVRSGPRLDKHIKHLQSVIDCEFISYNVDKGEWTFKVPHFTTYGLDYEDQDEMETDGVDLKSSVLSDTFSEATPAFLNAARHASYDDAESVQNSTDDQESYAEESHPEDTFGFKGSKHVPGGFEPITVSEDEQDENEDMEIEMQQVKHNGLSFLDKRSVVVQESEDEDEPSEALIGEQPDDQALVVQDTDLDLDMAGAFPEEPTNLHKSILKQSTFDDDYNRGPGVFLGDDWAEQLQRTISPRKRDRTELKASQAFLFRDANVDGLASPTKKTKPDNARLETSIDLMNSLFGKEDIRKGARKEKEIVKTGFKWPYNKDVDRDSTDLDETEQAFHQSFKPRWGPGNLLVHVTADGNDAGMQDTSDLIADGQNIRLSKFTAAKDLTNAVYERQSQRSDIGVEDGIPFAKPLKLPLAGHEQESTGNKSEETLIWTLAGILFDKHEDDVSSSLSEQQPQNYKTRVQKDRLAAFWRVLCKEDALKAVAESTTLEERAVHYLSTGAVIEACNALSNGKDFRLATLISQIGGDKIMHQDMAQQIKEWRRLNVLSEMTEQVRTLYELLSGNACVSEGRQGPVEDRATTFTISQKYNLNWKRSFGLRLWYAITDDESLDAAVKKYLHDLNGPETSKPKPRFLKRNDNNNSTAWSDPSPESREDILWGLLRLFTDRNNTKPSVHLSNVVAPENVRGTPMDNCLSWELYFALLPYLPQQKSPEAADKLTISFAAELESAKLWTWAIFVLLHMSNAQQRGVAVRDLLARQAAVIDIESTQTQEILFNQLHIPKSWVYEAKALYARAVEQDRSSELHYLQQAGNWIEAHDVLCRTVAPKAIIEREYEFLHKILSDFEDGEKPHTWRTGGAVYQDYLSLLSSKDTTERSKLLKHLLRSVPDLAHANLSKSTTSSSARPHTTHPHSSHKKRKGTAEKGSDSEGFLRSVAVKEMSNVIGDMVLRDNENVREHALILNLPLSEDVRRERNREIGLEYYRKVMAMG